MRDHNQLHSKDSNAADFWRLLIDLGCRPETQRHGVLYALLEDQLVESIDRKRIEFDENGKSTLMPGIEPRSSKDSSLSGLYPAIT
jgi:hypothetical protein